MRRAWGGVVALGLLSACTSTAGQQFSVNAARQIRPGVTDKSQVQSYLGQPLSRVNINGEDTWTYSYANTSVDIGAQNFIPIVGPFLPGAQGASYDVSSVTINFRGDIVSKCTLTTSSTTAESQGGLNGAMIAPYNPSQTVNVGDCSRQ